jgi:hypothetical protein
MFKGVHVQEFRATFSMMRRGYATGSTNDHSAYFIFNATKAYDLTEHEDDFASTSVGDFARSGNPAGASGAAEAPRSPPVALIRRGRPLARRRGLTFEALSWVRELPLAGVRTRRFNYATAPVPRHSARADTLPHPSCFRPPRLRHRLCIRFLSRILLTHSSRPQARLRRRLRSRPAAPGPTQPPTQAPTMTPDRHA